jgi:hypothetical protein
MESRDRERRKGEGGERVEKLTQARQRRVQFSAGADHPEAELGDDKRQSKVADEMHLNENQNQSQNMQGGDQEQAPQETFAGDADREDYAEAPEPGGQAESDFKQNPAKVTQRKKGADNKALSSSESSSDSDWERKQASDAQLQQQLENPNPILPWSLVRQQIVHLLNPRNHHPNHPGGGGLSPPNAGGLATQHSAREALLHRLTQQQQQPLANAHILSLTLPHGFQLVRTILHPRPTIRSAIYMPLNAQADLFVTLDTHNFNVFKGSVRTRKCPINMIGHRDATNTSQSNSQQNASGARSNGKSFGTRGGPGQTESSRVQFGISKWVYHKKWKIFILATTHLQLRVSACSCCFRPKKALDTCFSL